MIKKFLLIKFAILLCMPVFGLGFEQKDAVTLYKKINPSVVAVDSQLSDGMSSGSGCVISKNGLILTSAHVIEDGEDVIVTLNNGQNYPAKVIKRFGDTEDFAILKISTIVDLPVIKLGNSEKIKVGEKVFAIGNPFGFSGTFTQGIISRIDYTKNRIQTDAAINPGSSGGPLLNTKGEVIGINQAIYNPDNNISNIGIGFATPINNIKEYLKLGKI